MLFSTPVALTDFTKDICMFQRLPDSMAGVFFDPFQGI
jgi:hypothetical protein